MVALSVALPARAKKEVATAGTGNPTLTTGDAPDSICPYGWRLPKNDGDKSYNNLLTNVYTLKSSTNVDTSIIAIPFGFSRSGYYRYNGGLYVQASEGYYWSSSCYSQSNAYHLYFHASNLHPQNNNYRSNGRSLRCLAR